MCEIFLSLWDDVHFLNDSRGIGMACDFVNLSLNFPNLEGLSDPQLIRKPRLSLAPRAAGSVLLFPRHRNLYLFFQTWDSGWFSRSIPISQEAIR